MHKITLKFIIPAILIITIESQLKAQEPDSMVMFYGQIVGEDSKPIALAHIINIDSKRGIVSDTLGFFKIHVKPNHILNLSAIGFEYTEYQIPRTIPDTIIRISLKRKFYEIPEVSISYLGTYKDFEYKVVHLDLPDINIINELVLKELPRIENPVPYEPTLGSPISLLYDMFSKEGKSRRKYNELKEREPAQLEIESKFNREIVKNITGLDGEELREFMDSCNFSDTFILNTSEYIIYSHILRNFEAFKKNKEVKVKTE
ncbi:MAG: hypothetical protein A2X13_11085 [Bacteroidetes bacterium GWC2_33_15]|nr:MAG: hypothetical protein A2X10_11125 [Bacteroidetes bacterium GWA2_33_15]OFX52588.1 MAG: hypothetical protein A2X13_11085 [Bacteroidetes bacterium GWC2_33_15]OFX63933.1 MAG: hypothetical protein A2X15_03430 [Bacteroidetes bacterium GWB2_32_14]OFX70800.1 MAG: hypothetical protein A2X14_00160 [Bacteroidetes bacterium GWD2_33_33]HAN19928.1 hypothetical protein [Bacteroidales bacterium]